MLYVAGIGLVAPGVHGPRETVTVHFQGCTLACPGCFNQHLWPKYANSRAYKYTELANRVLAMSAEAGYCPIVFSGGEPLQQGDDVYALFDMVGPLRDTILFTGYTEMELLEISGWQCQSLEQLSVIVAGRFDVSAVVHDGSIRSSANQTLLVKSYEHTRLTSRMKDLSISVQADGTTILFGFPSAKLLEKLRE